MRTAIFKMAIIASIFFELFIVIEAHSEEKTIRLVCKYTHSIESDGKRDPIRGETLVTVKYSEDGSASIKKEDYSSEYSGKVSDEEIYGKYEYKLWDDLCTETIRINRYTGNFQFRTRISGTKNSHLTFYGTCELASEKKF